MDHKVEVMPAKQQHVDEIAPRVRECDKAEIWAQIHMDPHTALTCSLQTGPETCACLLDGSVVAIFGAVPAPRAQDGGRTAVLWMIGSKALTSTGGGRPPASAPEGRASNNSRSNSK